MSHQIVIVDDDVNIRNLIQGYLQSEGFETIAVGSAEEALVRTQTSQPSLWVLDVMLPGLDGYELCQRIREQEEMPIIMISALDEDINRIKGIEIGSDDYLTKPFSPRELVVRVKRLLYRWDMVQKNADTHKQSDPSSRLGSESQTPKNQLSFIPAKRKIQWGDIEILLTPKEFALLRYLFVRTNETCTRDAILRDIWGDTPSMSDRVVDHVVKRLRKKINGIPIENVWGHGYRLTQGRD